MSQSEEQLGFNEALVDLSPRLKRFALAMRASLLRQTLLRAALMSPASAMSSITICPMCLRLTCTGSAERRAQAPRETLSAWRVKITRCTSNASKRPSKRRSPWNGRKMTCSSNPRKAPRKPRRADAPGDRAKGEAGHAVPEGLPENLRAAEAGHARAVRPVLKAPAGVPAASLRKPLPDPGLKKPSE